MEQHVAEKNFTGPDGIKARRLVTYGGDVLLGIVTVPLLGLLTRKTGEDLG